VPTCVPVAPDADKVRRPKWASALLPVPESPSADIDPDQVMTPALPADCPTMPRTAPMVVVVTDESVIVPEVVPVADTAGPATTVPDAPEKQARTPPIWSVADCVTTSGHVSEPLSTRVAMSIRQVAPEF
jgi:hypothetical protein